MGIHLRQSDLATWMRCSLQWRYQSIDKLPREEGSATWFGSAIHEAVKYLEETSDLPGAKKVFKTYLDNNNVDYFLPRTSYHSYVEKGEKILDHWWSIIQWEADKVIAREHYFEVPFGKRGHTLVGTVDKVAARYKKAQNFIAIIDFKSTTKQPTREYLRHDVQFTVYGYASTRPEFWATIPDGDRLYAAYADAPRVGEWVGLGIYGAPKRLDCGERNQRDYQRLEYIVDAIEDSIAMGIFVPTLKGEVCEFCFGGETRYWTADGVKSFAETVGTTQRILANTGGGGAWVEAPVRHYGKDRLDTVVLRRGKARKEVRATPKHRWNVRIRKNDDRTDSRIVTTDALQPGDRLLAITPRTSHKSMVSPFGIAAGIVYGDGHLPAGRNAAEVILYGAKAVDLVGYFTGCDMTTKDDRIFVRGLPRAFKAPPSLEEARSYLLGWLAGYMATDGCASGGQITLSSTRQESIEIARAVAARCGIASGILQSADRHTKIGGKEYDTTLWTIQLRTSDLPDGFLIRPHHAAVPRRESRSLTWTVESVTPGVGVEDVYCVEVPEYENFTLEDWINVGNCQFRKLCGLPTREEEQAELSA